MKQTLTDLAELLGVGSIVAGVVMISIPAAFIVGGLLLLALSWRVSR